MELFRSSHCFEVEQRHLASCGSEFCSWFKELKLFLFRVKCSTNISSGLHIALRLDKDIEPVACSSEFLILVQRTLLLKVFVGSEIF